MTRTITWLHLSDLHACTPNSGWDAKRVLESLRRDLRRMRDDQKLVPDLIFFSGDAAFGHLGSEKGKAIGDQFREAHDFLTAVREEFSPAVPQRNVFLVPGNHDVNRTVITSFETKWIEEMRSLDEIERIMREAKTDWQQLTRRLHDYGHFLQSSGYEHLLTQPEHLIYADLREVAGVRIGIGGFNSAWSSRGAGREEIGKLWMAGRFQLETVLKALPPHDLRIALIHHPGNWLVPEENQNPKFFDELHRDFHFVLHGHEHNQWVRQDASNQHTILSAGACHEWSTTKNNGYSFVRLNLDTAQGEVWLREYESKGGGWRPCVVTDKTNNDGLWPLDLTKLLMSLKPMTDEQPAQSVPLPSVTSASVSPEVDYETRYRKAVVDRLDHMQLFGIDVPRDSKEYPLSIAFVSVNLADDEDDETENSRDDKAAASQASAEGIAASTSLPAEKFFDKLNRVTKRLLIRGAAGCGKTTLLRWAAVQAGKRDGKNDWRERVPFLIRLRDYPQGQLPRPQDFPLLLAKELPDAPQDWMTKLLNDGRALVLFDGVDEVPEARRSETLHEIGQLLKTYPRIACVVTSRTSAVDRGDFAELRFVTARVEALSPHDRNQLIDRWHRAMETHLRLRGESIDLQPLGERLKRRLEQTPAVARLTINPLLCAVVCALHRDREENLPDTPVGLCEKLTEMLLDRRDRERPGIQSEHTEDPDYRRLKYAQRKGLLARLAHHMILTGQSAVPEAEAISQIGEGLKSYQLTDLSPSRMLRVLLERSGLLQESSEQTIEFLHNTLKEFLAAELFANRAEVQALADHCHDAAWQPVILFVVALPREGSNFATELVRAIRDKTPLESPELDPMSKQQVAAAASLRSKQFFFFRCCVAAHQIDDPLILQQFQKLHSDLLPPRNLTDAEVLATCGEAFVPYLAYNEDWSEQQRAACVRTLGLIGGPLAKRFMEQYLQDSTETVGRQLLEFVDDPLSISAAIAWIQQHGVRPVWIDRRRITSVSRLAGLTTLKSLNLSETQVRDVSALAGLINLQTLDLSHTGVSDVAALAGLTNLQTLYLNGTGVRDVSALAELTNLQTLNLKDAEVSDVSVLAGLTNLQSLYLWSTGVSDISALAALNKLHALYLYKTPVSDISALNHLVQRGLKIYR